MKAASLILPILLATSCAGTGDRPAADFSPTAIPGAEQHMTGAYTAQREPSEEEVSLLGQVAGDENLLLTPLSVATQVVAGLNYKFWCRYEDRSDGTYGNCWVVIYKDLQGNTSLTSIKKE